MALFKGDIVKLTQSQKEQILFGENVHHFPLEIDELSLLTLSYFDFNGISQQGEMVIYSELADEVINIFNKLHRARFPIASMQHIHEYNHCDRCSMEQNNSYAYCFRTISETDRLSWHSFGVAIDINPMQNPCITQQEIMPKSGKKYRNRKSQLPGMISEGGVVHRAFSEAGWEWGGDWQTLKDYHHFQKPLDHLEPLRHGHQYQEFCSVCA